MTKTELDTLALLRRIMAKLREDSGSTDPMEPFAYDKSWEDVAVKADAALAAVWAFHNWVEG